MAYQLVRRARNCAVIWSRVVFVGKPYASAREAAVAALDATGDHGTIRIIPASAPRANPFVFGRLCEVDYLGHVDMAPTFALDLLSEPVVVETLGGRLTASPAIRPRVMEG